MAGTARGALASSIGGMALWGPRSRRRILSALGVRMARSVRVYPYIKFLGGVYHLVVGERVFLNANVLIGSGAPITIGDGVSIGPSVQLLPTSHEIGPSNARAGSNVSAPIVVGDGSWIGAGVTVLGGVTIGRGAVIAAGAVVSKDCEADSVYGGVPARLIRRIE